MLNILITGCLWDSVYLVCMIRVVNPLLVVGDMLHLSWESSSKNLIWCNGFGTFWNWSF